MTELLPTTTFDPPMTVVCVPSSGEAYTESFLSLDRLVQFLKTKSREPENGTIQVFLFQGTRWRLSSGRFQYLLDPDGKPVSPLFDSVVNVEPEPHNYLHADPQPYTDGLPGSIFSHEEEPVLDGPESAIDPDLDEDDEEDEDS